jgi:hypothetical protein
LEDVSNAATLGGHLANILEQLEMSGALSPTIQNSLSRKGFLALRRLAAGEITYAVYLPLAEQEQAVRRPAATITAEWLCAEKARQEYERKEHVRLERVQVEAARQEYERQERDRLERAQAEAAQRALINSPRYQAQKRDKSLQDKYGLAAFISPDDYPELMRMLRLLDKGQRIVLADHTWLKVHGCANYDSYLTVKLAARYHEVEAQFHAAQFKLTGNPRSAVHASSHFRKCGRPEQAESLLGGIDVSSIQDPKLQSALFTTHGGAKRDLGALGEALEFGRQAHALTPRNFHPCTLQGAVLYQMGDYQAGRMWYDKAVERGFREKDVDKALRDIMKRLAPKAQKTLGTHLLGLDGHRYSWAKQYI